MRITVALRSSGEATVTRRAPGIESRIVSRRGAVWFSPPGLQDGSVDFAQDAPEFLHLYLPVSYFSSGNLSIDTYQSVVGALSFQTAREDPLLAEIGFAIVSELKAETSAGRLMVESLANSMAARLVQKYTSIQPAESVALLPRGGLDRRRLLRVLDYIEANLEGDLDLDGMASIACLSRFHFARAFKQAAGQSPHRYVSARRLKRAKALLIEEDRPLVDIALGLSFSSQANFTRAFKQATGLAPGRYRRQAGSLQRALPADVRETLPVLA